MPFTCSKPVLSVEMASSSEQPEKNDTSEQEGKHSNILCIVDNEHSDQVSSGDQTSIDWDTDYIVQHAKLMGQIREKISTKAMANITIAQTKDKLYYDQRHADSKVTLLNRIYMHHNLF